MKPDLQHSFEDFNRDEVERERDAALDRIAELEFQVAALEEKVQILEERP